MAFNMFPYSNMHELNLDWIIGKVKEFNERLDTIREGILTEANGYTDAEIAKFNATFTNEMDAFRRDYNAFVRQVNNTLELYQTQLNLFDKELKDSIIGVNARTDLAIKQNNEYIIQEVQDNISSVLVVLDPFTGEIATIQKMIDYLSNFHMQNAATYGDIQTSNKTWEQVANFGASWQDITVSGKNFF